jgi:uncharacterized membrane protein
VGLFQSPLAAVRRYIAKDSLLGALAHSDALRAAREAGAGRFLRHNLPPDAVIQAHPFEQRLELAQIARRQIGIMVLEQDTMVFYPTDPAAHQQALEAIAEVLEEPVGAPRCHEILRAHGITHVFVGTVERELWQGLDKFGDPRFFERLFHDHESSIYELR